MAPSRRREIADRQPASGATSSSRSPGPTAQPVRQRSRRAAVARHVQDGPTQAAASAPSGSGTPLVSGWN